MFRLTPADVLPVGGDWKTFEDALGRLTGQDLAGLCASALDIESGRARDLLSSQTVVVVPDPGGGGIIEGFGEALASTAAHLGAKSFLASPAPGGFADARSMGATITLSSCDDSYLAENLLTGRVSENAQATGRVFAEALALMGGGDARGKTVLVVGAGPVGRAAAARLLRKGATPVLLDADPYLADKAAAILTGAKAWSASLGRVPEDFKLILEASSAERLWPAERIAPGTLISAPGLPRAIPETPRAKQWHEPLATSSAMMVLEASLEPGA
jgi:pyrrolysine biosynthesis protein PylD